MEDLKMAVIDKSEDKQAVQTAVEEQRELEDKFLKQITGKEDTEKKEEEKPSKEEEKEENEEPSEAEETKADETETEEEQETEAEEEEKPDSAQRRINELTAEKRRLESEINKLKATAPSGETDPDMARLSKMNQEQLKNLKREVMIAWKSEEDPGKSARLLELGEKVDEAIQTLPKRFYQSQLSNYLEAVKATSEEFGEKFTKDSQKKIFDKANIIFEKYPALQKSEDGQAIAWNQAVDWFKEVSSFGKTRVKSVELERENNKLKKKISIDSAVSKGAQKSSENERLFQKAKSGDKRAEIEFFKNELGL
jgi:hypothetical protein